MRSLLCNYILCFAVGTAALLCCPARTAAAADAGQDDAVTYGTSTLQSPHFSDKGQARTCTDPDTGIGITSGIPPVRACLRGETDMQTQFWDALPGDEVVCRLCAHGCRLKRGGKGLCGVRVNSNGQMVSLVRDVVTAVNMDPVEKKPLYHFLPGSRTFSVGSAGCNFSCRFCQNHGIAQIPENGVIPGRRAAPEDLAVLAQSHKARSVAFTYNEPTVFFELMFETAGLAMARGMPCLMVSNGHMSRDCLSALNTRIRAANVDLKSFRDSFYRQYCGARLQPVLDNLKTMRQLGWWLEVTTLVIPGCNDSPEELADMASFLFHELGPDTPWHLSAFHGAHRMADHPSTPLATLEQGWRLGREAGLRYVYMGNTHSALGAHTFCPSCGGLVIERRGYEVRLPPRAGLCPACATPLAGVWK